MLIVLSLRLYFGKKTDKHTVKKAKDRFDCFPAVFFFKRLDGDHYREFVCPLWSCGENLMLWQSGLIYLTDLRKQTADFLGKRENVSWENDFIKIYEPTVTHTLLRVGVRV